MLNYVLRRLLLLPITLFFIVLVNFVIVNLAPGDPVTISDVSQQGVAKREDRSIAFGSDDRYLQFREFYGLTLPIIINTWPYLSKEYVTNTLWKLTYKKNAATDTQEMSFKAYDELRVGFGDRSRFIMPILLSIVEDAHVKRPIKIMAVRFFIRGGTRPAYVGPNLTAEQKAQNNEIAKNNQYLSTLLVSSSDSETEMNEKIGLLHQWYMEHWLSYNFAPSESEKVQMIFFETRFFRYMSRILRLDFGTLRNDPNKTVVSEVVRRFKYSLTLALLPMLITFVLCQILGVTMAYTQNRWPDIILNLLCLILYAIPIFIVAPFLIEKVALNHHIPFTDIPIPISGFTSPEAVYEKEISYQRLFDVLIHIALPLVAIIYGSLASQARISRTAVLEVLHQDYVRTARAKGLTPFTIMFKHVGRNAGITIVTSIAGSLGIVLGGSLIVETLFGINGFGKFFYDAIVNRDYNVIMFSALAGSFLTLIGYLIADLAYTMLDPRVTLD